MARCLSEHYVEIDTCILECCLGLRSRARSATRSRIDDQQNLGKFRGSHPGEISGCRTSAKKLEIPCTRTQFPQDMKLWPLTFGALLLIAPISSNAVPATPTGLYVGTLLNAHPLPRIERVPSQDGWEHWFKLEGANITLRPGNRFIASFKYYRQHVPPRAPVRPGPLLNETYKGKFTIRGKEITFQPDPTK
jgi:hypothetical protein